MKIDISSYRSVGYKVDQEFLSCSIENRIVVKCLIYFKEDLSL